MSLLEILHITGIASLLMIMFASVFGTIIGLITPAIEDSWKGYLGTIYQVYKVLCASYALTVLPGLLISTLL